ncbi:MAG: hypothetical protein CUN56_01235 [Phototrophicales bacterium]|nr:MAG: hypothetical protein CUN56_01235 [Phototrophicales bacterium]RMG72395.1 MAG: hypothetical protein D6711_13055 [Chloroflexota bacterium]
MEVLMSDSKQYTTEWSFSFEALNKTISDLVDSLNIRDEDVKIASFSEPKSGVHKAHVNLKLSLGEVSIQPLTASHNLIEADVTYMGEMLFEVEGEAEKVVTLRQKISGVGEKIKQTVGLFNRREDLRWDVRLSPDVPMSISLEGGVGPTHANLLGIQLARLEVDGGVGETTVILPQSYEAYSVVVNGGVGSMKLVVPEDTNVSIAVRGGVGAISVQIPRHAAATVAAHGGLGKITMPKHLNRIHKDNDFISRGGVWETERYTDAEYQIAINFDGGLGSFRITIPEDVE